VDRFTDGITGLARREHPVPYLPADELLYQAGDYGVVRIAVREEAGSAGLALAETGLVERGATVLAIERGDRVLLDPERKRLCWRGTTCCAMAKFPVSLPSCTIVRAAA